MKDEAESTNFTLVLLPKQRVVPRFLPELCEMAATFSTSLG